MLVRRLLAAVCAVPLLVACQPGPSTPGPTATSTQATPMTSPTPSEEELFRQASDVYRRIRVEIDKLEAAGGAKVLPPSLTQYVTGEIEANIRATYTLDWPGDKKRRVGDPPTIAWLRLATVEVQGAVVSTVACVDASRAVIRYADGRENPGGIQQQTLHYSYFAGALKAFDSSSDRVEKC